MNLIIISIVLSIPILIFNLSIVYATDISIYTSKTSKITKDNCLDIRNLIVASVTVPEKYRKYIPKSPLKHLEEGNYYQQYSKDTDEGCYDDLNVGILFIDERQYKKAITYLKDIEKNQPCYIESQYHIGVCYYQLEKFKKAKKCLEKVVKIDKGFDKGMADLLLNSTNLKLYREKDIESSSKKSSSLFKKKNKEVTNKKNKEVTNFLGYSIRPWRCADGDGNHWDFTQDNQYMDGTVACCIMASYWQEGIIVPTTNYRVSPMPYNEEYKNYAYPIYSDLRTWYNLSYEDKITICIAAANHRTSKFSIIEVFDKNTDKLLGRWIGKGIPGSRYRIGRYTDY